MVVSRCGVDSLAAVVAMPSRYQRPRTDRRRRQATRDAPALPSGSWTKRSKDAGSVVCESTRATSSCPRGEDAAPRSVRGPLGAVALLELLPAPAPAQIGR